MSGPVTEFVYVPIKSSVSIDSGEGKDVLHGVLKEIAGIAGVKRLLWGVQIENPNIAQIVVDWESLEAHKTFEASPAYGPFLERLAPILSGAPHVFHIRLPVSSYESGRPAFESPVTECVSVYLPLSYDEKDYDDNFAIFSEKILAIPDTGAVGLISGWGVEQHDDEGAMKKYFGAFVGWPSVEHHEEFGKKGGGYPDIVRYMKEGPDRINVHHVAFKKFEG